MHAHALSGCQNNRRDLSYHAPTSTLPKSGRSLPGGQAKTIVTILVQKGRECKDCQKAGIFTFPSNFLGNHLRPAINTGKVRYVLSGYFGSDSNNPNTSQLHMFFESGSGSSKGEVIVGHVTPARATEQDRSAIPGSYRLRALRDSADQPASAVRLLCSRL